MIRRILTAGVKVLVAVALFLITIEAVLRLSPDVLPPRLANHAFSRYGNFPGGIYFFDPESRIHFQRRDFEAQAYFNGYRWTHATDRYGFRKPEWPGPGGILLLGDSLIYGHGVDEIDTVAHLLRSEQQLPAYNMARQGDSLYQSYVLLRLNVEALEPDAVVLFVFLNDIHDLTLYRSEQELLERPETDWDYGAFGDRLKALEASNALHPRLLLGLPSMRLLRGLWREMPLGALMATAEAAETAPHRPAARRPPAHQPPAPPYLDVLLDPAAFARAAHYYDATLADLRDRLAARDIDLLVVDLAVDVDLGEKGARAQRELSSFLTGACQRLELRCASTAGLFAGCAACFLPGDGHLSPEGHHRLAGWLSQNLAGPN